MKVKDEPFSKKKLRASFGDIIDNPYFESVHLIWLAKQGWKYLDRLDAKKRLDKSSAVLTEAVMSDIKTSNPTSLAAISKCVEALKVVKIVGELEFFRKSNSGVEYSYFEPLYQSPKQDQVRQLIVIDMENYGSFLPYTFSQYLERVKGLCSDRKETKTDEFKRHLKRLKKEYDFRFKKAKKGAPFKISKPVKASKFGRRADVLDRKNFPPI